MERREFLKLVGITGAGAVTACDEKVGPQALIPYLVPPEHITPGIPTWYASTCRECPAGCGTHVKTREGRVIKIEGNPESPVNRGHLCARGQAAHQHLYDPDRLKGPRRFDGDEYVDVSWEDAIQAVAAELGPAGQPGSVVLLSGLQTGTRARLYQEWADAVGASWLVHEPFAQEPVVEAHRRIYGMAAIPSYDIAGAELVISFGADILETWVSPVRYSVDWAAMHAFRGGAEERDRRRGIFVVVGPRLSMTASNADEWISVPPGTEQLVALGMANVLGAGGEATAWTPVRVAEATGVAAETIERLARLFGERRSLALPGGVASQHAHATAVNVAAALLNQAGGAIGDTIALTPVTGAVERSHQDAIDLVNRMRGGLVRAILFADGVNPAFALPPVVGFAPALRNVPLKVSLSPLFDETAAHCHWLLPDHTPLESWGDWVPEEGTVSIQQPAMRPLYNTRATPDVLLDLHRAARGAAQTPGGEVPAADLGTAQTPGGEAPAGGLGAASWYDYLRAAWQERAATPAAWAELLKAGGVWEGAIGAAAVGVGGQRAGAAAAPPAGAAVTPAVAGDTAQAPLDLPPLDFAPAPFQGPTEGDTFVLHLFPHIALYDGRGASRPWLQELPEPAATVMWHTWVEIHPQVAERLGVEDGDVLELESPHGELEAPALVYPGARPDTVAMPLGRGHTRMGRFAAGHGVNPLVLLPGVVDAASGALAYQSVRVRVTKTGARVPPLKAQGSDIQHDRDLAQATPMAAALRMEADHRAVHESAAPDEALEHGEALTVERVARDSAKESPYRWGMAISLDACTGCGACVVACQAENNIPFVGPERVVKSRQMQWIRIERFFEQDADGRLETRHLPMLCQHCGAAPCEPVCPVYATYHNPDGLNVQVYNRCVGTRYCSNNCPYKVRYFNWFTYEWPEPMNLGLNPDVTVREKGVMEKCTFCVQRINAAKIAYKDLDPEGAIPDGFFQTACQQTCPTEAIVFGNLKDSESRAARLANGELAYNVLEVLNTRPANFYLRQVNGRLDEARLPGGGET
jgi:anaerobic selenocysteine-containing dehydrogenase/Fe-S-cluster-containing dehydrogenase component